MKLVLNLVLGLNRAVLAEGLCYAAAAGVDPAAALEILKAGPAYSRVMDTKGQKMLAGDFTAEARLSQHLKDVRLILESGARAGASLPLSSVHRALLEKAEAAGFGAADNSAVIKAFAKEQLR
jgi:3-hydroxyisobutyrate dehydrogenase-like beta-hydroxyacid dehydrogenase